MIPASGGGGQKLLIFLALLDVLSAKVGIGHGHDHQAFIQSEQDLRYLVDDGVDVQSFSKTISPDGSPGSSSHGSSNHRDDGIKVLGSPIKFDPPELDFSEQPIGLPVLRKVRVHNLNAQSSIQMLSISGNTIHFHCSFFTDKVIPPSGNTTFDVVFLGREEGPVENTLYIHTSAGSFRFLVKAQGTPNPYRLKPLVGVKLPLNSSYSPMIQLHNPHPEPIQVLEMYSSGGDLHLELPDGATEGSDAIWQIPPYQTKAVMKANFVARLENNHTAYIRIKTNTTGAEFLYLPLEVEVTSQPGIYSPQEIIDFGLVPSKSDTKTVKLLVYNSGSKAIQVQNVIATPVTEAISVHFKPLKVQPETLRAKAIAEVTFNPSLVSEEGLLSGKIVIKSKNSQFKISIPYRAFVLKGQLEVAPNVTHFHLKSNINNNNGGDSEVGSGAENAAKNNNNQFLLSRPLTVTNEFDRPVAVHNVSLASEALRFFHIEEATKTTTNSAAEGGRTFGPVILKPGETKDLIQLSLTQIAWEEKILNSYLTIHTNISSINVPLICFHGMVKTFFPGSPSQDVLDFGTLGMNEKRDIFFTLLNENPIPVYLKGWGSNLTGSLVELMGVEEGNETTILERFTFSSMGRQLVIPPNHFMAFRIGILTPTEKEGATNATVYVETNYQKFEVPFRFRVAKGSLHTVPKELIFDPVFPGKKTELKLKVFSSFAEEMITDHITTVPPDPRFSFKHAVHDGRTVIMSGEKSFIGKVVFDPGASCRDDESCYSGIPLNTKTGKEWLEGLSLGSSTSETDVGLITNLWSRLRSAVSPSSSFNITLNLDTNQVRGFLFKARARLVWPKMTPAALERLVFPLTQVGNSSVKEVALTNPSEEPVLIHLVPMTNYPNIDVLMNKAAAIFKNPTEEFSNSSDFRVVSAYDVTTNSPLTGLGSLGVELHSNTKGFILKPGTSAKVKIRFDPETVGHFRNGIIIRNNLTGLEFLELFGEAVLGEIKFGKFKATPLTPASSLDKAVLDFDMKEKHLRGCTTPPKESAAKSSRLGDGPLYTVKRSFKAKNSGLTSLHVKGFDIEGHMCEGYGFKILNCESFNLAPNETREIHVAFTPDFTLSRISRKLTMTTTMKYLEKINYTLVASVPSHMLSICAKTLPRPQWESYVFWVLNGLMIGLIIIIICAAGYDADRILNTPYFSPIIQFDEKGQLLDLRQVADLVRKELNVHHNNASAAHADSSSHHNSHNNSSSTRLGSRNSIQEIQPISSSSNGSALGKPLAAATTTPTKSSLIPRKMPKFLSSIRAILRAIGVGIFSLVWRTNKKSEIQSRQDLNNKNNDSEEDEEDHHHNKNHDIEDLVNHKDHLLVNKMPNNSQHQNNTKNNKNGGKNNKKVNNQQQQRKKSLTDLDEASSTTTESSTLDDLNDSKSSLDLQNTSIPSSITKSNIKSSKKQGGGGKPTQTVSANTTKPSVEPIVPSSTNNNQAAKNNNKKSNKKSPSGVNNTDQKKSSPERPSAVNNGNKKSPTTATATSQSNNNKTTGHTETVSVKPQQHQEAQPQQHSQQQSHVQQQQHQQQQQPSPLSTQTVEPQPKKVKQVGKILPEIKKPENHGAQFGPVGAKPPLKPAWHEEQPQPPYNMAQQGADQPDQQRGYGSHQTSNGNSPARSGGPSFMSQLQQQRREETAKYVSDRINRDWPGFDSSPTYLAQDTSDLRSLWDDQQSPLVSASDNIWSQAGLWTDMGRSNGPTSSYVGGLSVAAQQQQQQQQQHQLHQQQQRSDLFSSPPHTMAQSVAPVQLQQQQQQQVGNGLGFGLDPIWGNAQQQQQQQQQQDDELNRYQQQQIQQQQQHSMMNNSWSGLFRNK